jgi:serine phosphatase RsbU (regulator of sigma subunit)
MIRDISKLLKEKEIKFEANDVIVMYSDGITEAINRPTKDGTESMFLEDRLEDSINQAPEINNR